MKKIIVVLIAAFMTSLSVPVFAEQMTKGEKDQCLLIAKGCEGEVDSIQKRINKINAEIKKGKKVYSAEELKKLQEKLKEADEILKVLEKP